MSGPRWVTHEHPISPATLLERAFADIVLLQAYGLQGDVAAQYATALESDVRFKKK